MLWGSTPDQVLLDAASAGELTTDAGIEGQARRLLADPRAQDALAEFHSAWLGAKSLRAGEKNADAFPDFDDALVLAMSEERRRFVADVIGNGGTVEDLLTARFTYVNDALAELYEIQEQEPAPAGQEWRRVQLEDGKRQGILTQGGVLAAHAGPTSTPVVKRGRFMLNDVVCGTAPPFPPGVNPQPPLEEKNPNMSPREQWEAVHAIPGTSCGGCHAVLDPLGWGFDHFDAIGQWRDNNGGFPIDASSEWNGQAFDGAVELTDLVAASAQTRDCYASHWVTFATDRLHPTNGADMCSLDALQAAFEQSGGTIDELLLEIATSAMFRHTGKVSS